MFCHVPWTLQHALHSKIGLRAQTVCRGPSHHIGLDSLRNAHTTRLLVFAVAIAIAAAFILSMR